MPKRKAPPSRQRYEQGHPSLTVRLPAAVKERVAELARAQGLSVSEWVQAAAAEHEADPADAYRRGRDDGYADGHKAGAAEGRRAGLAVGARAGARTGILLDVLARKDGREFDVTAVAHKLAADEEGLQIAAAVARQYGEEASLSRFMARLRTGRR